MSTQLIANRPRRAPTIVAGNLAIAALTGLAAIFAASSVSAAQLISTGQPVNPSLAEGVKRQAGYEKVAESLVVGNPTSIYSDIVWTSPRTGELDVVGQPVDALAKVNNWNWVLVGRNGVGIGYVSADLLRAVPAKPAARK